MFGKKTVRRELVKSEKIDAKWNDERIRPIGGLVDFGKATTEKFAEAVIANCIGDLTALEALARPILGLSRMQSDHGEPMARTSIVYSIYGFLGTPGTFNHCCFV